MWSRKVQASLKKKKSWILGFGCVDVAFKGWTECSAKVKGGAGMSTQDGWRFTNTAEALGLIGAINFRHILGSIQDLKITCEQLKPVKSIYPLYFYLRCRPSSPQRSLLMWPGTPWATSQQRKRERIKDLIHSHRCVTPLLPQQRLTTELMTKGRAPIVARRTMWRLWKANPSTPLTGRAFKQTRGPASPRGRVAVWQRWENLRRSPPLSPRPERWLGRHCQGRILSPLSGRWRLCSVRSWAPQMPHRRAARTGFAGFFPPTNFNHFFLYFITLCSYISLFYLIAK